jgi:hypothetical protein
MFKDLTAPRLVELDISVQIKYWHIIKILAWIFAQSTQKHCLTSQPTSEGLLLQSKTATIETNHVSPQVYRINVGMLAFPDLKIPLKQIPKTPTQCHLLGLRMLDATISRQDSTIIWCGQLSHSPVHDRIAV